MAAVVANQEVFAHTEALVETWNVGADVAENTLVKNNGRFGVTLTNSPGQTGKDTLNIGPYTVQRTKLVGVGNEDADAVGTNAAAVATDGTWEFSGIVSSGTTPVPTSTTQGTPVYALDADGSLTLASTSASKVGVVAYPSSYVKVAGTLPIKLIGSN